MAPPDPNPMPPGDFATRTLPIETIAAGTILHRIHGVRFDPLHFGTSGGNRFDDPMGGYGVCYLALSLEGAFAETCLRAVGAQFVAFAFLAERAAATIRVARPVRLVSLHGPGLAAIGATSLVSAGPHPISQAWSAAIHAHNDVPDGVIYRANHDNGEHCIALYERAQDAVRPDVSELFVQDRKRLASLLGRYGVALG